MTNQLDELGSITRELYVDAAPEVVFEVVSTPAYIREWWSADTSLDGATGRLTWTDDQTGRTDTAAFTVVEVDPPRRFAFRWTHAEGEIAAPGNSLLVAFDLAASGDGTTLRFSETGFRERGWEAAMLEAQYADHRQGWDFYLPRLAESARRAT